MPDPTTTTTATTTPSADDVLALDDAATIDWQVANRVPYPVDTDAIRREIARLLNKPRCAAFVSELIQRTAEDAGPDNTVVENGDVLKIYDRILACKESGGGRGVVRSGGPGSIGGANFAFGDMESGTASIQIGVVRIFAPMTVGQWKQMYLDSDGIFGLHETMHHAGMHRYTDKAYALAISAMVPDARPLPTVDEPTAYSRYWDNYLRESLR